MNIPDEVWERIRKAFASPELSDPNMLNPHAVAVMLRNVGQVVGDAVVLEVYEALRAERNKPDPPEVAEAKEFLASHEQYVEWKRAVARGETLGGFFEWKAQQS